jgi:hypothetical protein
VPTWNWFYPVFITTKKYDRRQNFSAHSHIIFNLVSALILLLQFLHFLSFFPPQTQMGDVKSPFIRACTIFLPDIS